MTWTCPRCARIFARARQSHSCRPSVPLDAHFASRPPWMRAAFDRIVRELEGVRVDGVAKGIHLAAASTFAGVTLTRERMRVEFLLEREVEDARIAKVERLGPTRVAHHVDVRAPADVDARLLAWLRRARDEHA